MITNSRVSQYSPNSEESDDQPLDFSKNSISASTLTSIIKRESNGRDRHSTPSPDVRQSPHQPPANCFTTPSPSPPEHNPNSHHTNQVLCQLLTGNLIPTSTGKLIAATAGKNVNPLSVQNDSSGLRFKGLNSESPNGLSASSPPNSSVIQALNERHNSSMSPTGSSSPIGMGPLNQVEMHFAHSPNASGVDRFGTSGGLLTTAPASGVFSANESAKRALKYSRPFKAYPRDPLSIPMSYYGVGIQMPLTADAIATQSLLATASDQAYLQFREQMLVSRKNTQGQEPRRNGQPPGPQSVSKNSSPTPDMLNSNSNHSNGNNMNNTHINSNNGNNQQNIYSNRSVSPPSSHSLTAKMNGSMAAMTPISSAPQINSDETLDYSNGNSSGNSSSGEADVGSMNSSGANSGRHSDGQSMRKRGRPLPEDLKDEAYWERRRKNNEAAKRSRDARRAKEDEIAIRAAFLEQENLKLRCEIAQLKTETTKLRCLLYNS